MSEEWKEKSMAHWELINSLALRRFSAQPLAEEAALFVMDSLAADSWQRVRKFSGKGTFRSFIASLSYRLLEDFSRKRFGRLRSPLWVKKLGGIWSLLFQFLCMQRLPLADAVESVATRCAAEEVVDVEEAALTLLSRIPQCGSHQGLEVGLQDDTVSENPRPDQVLEKEEQAHLFAVLFAQLAKGKEESSVSQPFAALLDDGVTITAGERLLLKLLYQDNMGVKRAAVLLGLNRDQVNGRLRRLLARLRQDFQRAGLAEEILELLR